MHETFDPDGLLERVGRSMPALRELTEMSQAMLQPGTAADATGSVRVTVDAEGIPEAIQLDADWFRRVGSEGLAAAVEQACENARHAGLEASAAAGDQEGLVERMTDLLNYIGGGPEPAGLPRTAPGQADHSAWAAHVDTEALADWMGSKSLDEIIAGARSQSGTAAYGALGLTIADGALTCTVDQQWLRGQETDDLDAAFAIAVDSLREAHSAALPTVSWPAPTQPDGSVPN